MNKGLCHGFALVCLLTTLVYRCNSDCPFPNNNLSNGKFIYANTEDEQNLTAPERYYLGFKCSEGYQLSGAPATICLFNKWSHEVPSCLSVECKSPPPVENAILTLKTGVSEYPTIGSVALYSCKAGFELENITVSNLTCHFESNSMIWVGDLPVCKKKDSCPTPIVSRDGTRTSICCFIGDSVNYKCNEGFTLVGNETIVCEEGGNWSSKRPRCKPQGPHCPTPPSIEHAAITGDKIGDYFLEDDEAEVQCKRGYKHKGKSRFILCDGEKWDLDFGECVEAFCEFPEPLQNGKISELESLENVTLLPFDFQLSYACDDGYRLNGNSWSFCDTNGWIGGKRLCEKILCPDPGFPEHGTRTGRSFEVGERVVFKCFDGYDLIGSYERYCQRNGQWSGTLSRCDIQYNYCADPGIPINGWKNSSDYKMGNIIHFSCSAGYTLIGSENRECQRNRSWSGEEALCSGPDDFDNSDRVSNTLKTAINERKLALERAEEKFKILQRDERDALGRALTVSNNERLILYFAFDTSGSIQKENFEKSIKFAKAIVKKIGISEKGARASALIFSSAAAVQFTPMDFKTTDRVLRALDDIKYNGGGTSATAALRRIREELIPTAQRSFLQEKIKSVVFILTDGKANMGGDPQEEAAQLKEANVEIYCVGITHSNEKDSLYKIATDIDHVFILKNYGVIDYLVQEILNGSVDYSECGRGHETLSVELQGKVVGGKSAAEPWPWMVALFHFEPGMPERFICGGSIIHKEFILTAAHCLHLTDGNKKHQDLKTTEIIVRLGLLDLTNKTKQEEHEVINFFRHRRYVKGIYDNDIALLHLKYPITYGPFIRPICLPPRVLPEKTTLYSPSEEAVALGWGHSGVLQTHYDPTEVKRSEKLKEIRLPIQPTDNCREYVIREKVTKKLGCEGDCSHEIFTRNMLCAGSGRGGNDTCPGDSGGPLMQSQNGPKGPYWVQVGLVSWGLGCGQVNSYGFYTNVHLFVHWIYHTIQETEDSKVRVEKTMGLNMPGRDDQRGNRQPFPLNPPFP